MQKRTKSNSIRIIAGEWRGRRLPVRDSVGLRPTTDRVRETLFNWLASSIPRANCLDLFAGTGALGLECLSRGAAFVQFLESDRVVAKTITGNLDLLQDQRNPHSANVRCADALSFVEAQATQAFELVFLDPPFKSEYLESSAELLEQNGWLADGALIYVEQDAHREPAVLPSSWQLKKQGKAGQSAYSLYQSKKR